MRSTHPCGEDKISCCCINGSVDLKIQMYMWSDLVTEVLRL